MGQGDWACACFKRLEGYPGQQAVSAHTRYGADQGVHCHVDPTSAVVDTAGDEERRPAPSQKRPFLYGICGQHRRHKTQVELKSVQIRDSCRVDHQNDIAARKYGGDRWLEIQQRCATDADQRHTCQQRKPCSRSQELSHHSPQHISAYGHCVPGGSWRATKTKSFTSTTPS